MNSVFRIMTMGAFATLLVTNAQATTIQNSKTMNNGLPITITGTVDSVQNEHKFTLRDQTGTITVDMNSDQSVVFSKGDQVTVHGTVDQGVFGTDINASSIAVGKKGASLGSGESSNTYENATFYSIKNLPKTGLVKVIGTVDSVSNEKKFTMSDGTDSITVKIAADKSAVLSKGAHVTVIGYVESGLINRTIKAEDVTVTNSTP